MCCFFQFYCVRAVFFFVVCERQKNTGDVCTQAADSNAADFVSSHNAPPLCLENRLSTTPYFSVMIVEIEDCHLGLLSNLLSLRGKPWEEPRWPPPSPPIHCRKPRLPTPRYL